jgi:hypothetical protein
MSEPAKDEAELIGRVARDLWEVPLGQVPSWNGKSYLADAAIAIAAIRAAGWAVVPVTEQDALRSENARLREALSGIASCESHHTGDVVSVARAALEVKP